VFVLLITSNNIISRTGMVRGLVPGHLVLWLLLVQSAEIALAGSNVPSARISLAFALWDLALSTTPGTTISGGESVLFFGG